MATQPSSSLPVFDFSFAAALDDDSLYLAGTARELEERDVPHTILWERLDGQWKRYQWKNRSYAIAAYECDGGRTGVYMGYEGTLKVRSTVHGSSEEVLEGGDDAPSSLRTVSSIRVVGTQLYVSGMRRMVYRRPLGDKTWSRFDDHMRQSRKDLDLAGLYSIDGRAESDLFAVGIGGEVWHCAGDAWRQLDSPTNLTLLAVRCLPGRQVVMAGERGALWVGDERGWAEVDHSFRDETFSCVEVWQGRCFLCSETGKAYELTLSRTPALSPFAVDGMSTVSWISATGQRAWFTGGNAVMSLSDGGWRDESPPASLLA